MPPPPNQAGAFRGASLYSGIFDQQDPPPQENKSASPSQQARPSNTTEFSAPSSRPDSATSDSKSTGGVGWSAALRFAPRKAATNAKAKARPNAAFVASFTAPTVSEAVENVPKGALSRAPGVAPKPPSSDEKGQSSETIPDSKEGSERGVGKVDTSDLNLTALALPTMENDDTQLAAQLAKYPVLEAPPFLLPPEQVEREKMLIRQYNAAAGRGWNEGDDEGGKCEEDGEEQDVNGFLATNPGRKAARRKQRKRKRGSPPPGPNMNSEYDPRIPNDYMAYKTMLFERRKAELEHQMWVRELEEHGEEEGRDEEEQEKEERSVGGIPPPPPQAAPIAVAKQPSSGQEAYARRLAMSNPIPTQPQRGEEAYQQRLAMSGEEAYQRRVALSQQQHPQASQGIPTGPEAGPPGPPPGPAPEPRSAAQTQLDVAARQTAAAAAIAGRLAQSQTRSSPSNRIPICTSSAGKDDTRSFAERYMTSQGYIPGQGIGAAGNKGITTPLTVSQNRSSSKKGSIINPDQKAQQQEELSKFGAPSRIIVLLNMITLSDLQREEEREELIEDIAGECGKYGIVKCILPFQLGGAEGGQEGQVRMFVEFSGEAAGWRAVRGLDGRWFEGRQVRAFYYHEEAFLQQRYNLLLSRPHT
ncbi:related to conserved hypothetcial protein [Ustilago sp. UG-2017a]|nr:related to conserved hypothetcial protein [Ustilago sp. UG-2017a]